MCIAAARKSTGPHPRSCPVEREVGSGERPYPVRSPLSPPRGHPHSATLPAPAEIMDQFAPYCRRLIRKYGTCPELRQDLIGETYCLVHELLQSYDTSRGVPLSAYLFSQLRAGVFTYARSEWRRAARELAPQDPEQTDGEPEAAHQIDAGWPERLTLRESIREALGQLTPRQAAVVRLRYFQERDFEEIAAIMGIKACTARSLLRHGLRHLREILQRDAAPTV